MLKATHVFIDLGIPGLETVRVPIDWLLADNKADNKADNNQDGDK